MLKFGFLFIIAILIGITTSVAQTTKLRALSPGTRSCQELDWSNRQSSEETLAFASGYLTAIQFHKPNLSIRISKISKKDISIRIKNTCDKNQNLLLYEASSLILIEEEVGDIVDQQIENSKKRR